MDEGVHRIVKVGYPRTASAEPGRDGRPVQSPAATDDRHKPQPPRPPGPGSPFASPGPGNPFASSPPPGPRNPFAGEPPAKGQAGHGPAQAPGQGSGHKPGEKRESAGGGIPPETLKNALKAFKKRLKLARLDDESRLGHGPMSGGGRSGISAIVPPAQYPDAVWEELHRQGKLRRAGGGMYELPE